MSNSIFSKFILSSISFLIIVSLLTGCRKEKNEIALKDPGIVTGTIVPPSAVQSVSIESRDGSHIYSTIPDSNGVFIFADIPQGDYSFKAVVSSIYYNPGDISFTVPEVGPTTLNYILLKYNPSAQTGVVTFTIDSMNYTITTDSLKFLQSKSWAELKGNTPYNPDYYRFQMGFNHMADVGSYSYNNSYFGFELFYYQAAGSTLKEYWKTINTCPTDRITITSSDKTNRIVSGTFDVVLNSFNTVNSKRVTGTFTNLRY